MRPTLRRSCAACAKSKHSCDLRTPRCSRCIKRKSECFYVNVPLTGRQPPSIVTESFVKSGTSIGFNRFGSVDPFDSYPPTRLPREHVQRLMYKFLHKIAFQYYPLDVDSNSNPFITSWWPLALSDPALFHVSLQTACLDEELLARKGFYFSALLMADSIALLRRKVDDVSLAVQDGTMNSVITLAAIEFGKGNIQASQMHVDGVRRLVDLRGGISSVRQTSPLTARMVSWVAMIVTCKPQFNTQDDLGRGQGVSSIPTWATSTTTLTDDLSGLGIKDSDIDREVQNVFVRLRNIFQQAKQVPLPPTWLHDLACFAIHRLLPSISETSLPRHSPITEQIRYATVLYMFLIQGPTYFSHAVMVNQIVTRFMEYLRQAESILSENDSLDIWSSMIGMIVSADLAASQWFSNRVKARAKSLQLDNWNDASFHIKRVLWLDSPSVEAIFRANWDICRDATQEPPKATDYIASNDTGTDSGEV